MVHFVCQVWLVVKEPHTKCFIYLMQVHITFVCSNSFMAWSSTCVYGIPGHFLRPGRARKKPDAKNPGLGPAQPDCRAKILCLGPAHGGCFLSGFRAIGPGLPKITCFSCPVPAQLGYWANFSYPARLYVLARWAGPFSGQVGPGFPCPGLVYGNHDKWRSVELVYPHHTHGW
jgi:hypothetical protein